MGWLRQKWRRFICGHPWWHRTGARIGLHPLRRLREQHVCVECGKIRWFRHDRPPINDVSYPKDPIRQLLKLDPMERWKDGATKI